MQITTLDIAAVGGQESGARLGIGRQKAACVRALVPVGGGRLGQVGAGLDHGDAVLALERPRAKRAVGDAHHRRDKEPAFELPF
jgi:hypothetical protein